MGGKVQIKQLTGLKILALFGIFCWHSLPQVGLPDLGARFVELFFVVSGFLVGLRRHGTFKASFSGGWEYVAPKVRGLYPVYLIGLALGVLLVALKGGLGLRADSILPIAWALALQQAWIPSIAMKYNGAAWFISAWAFCMLCSPALQWLLDGARRTLGPAKGSLTLFASLLAVRIFLEACQVVCPGVYPYSLHVTPFVRLLEFGLAYVSGVWFGERGDRPRSPIAGSCLEVAAATILALCITLLDNTWPRWAFVLAWVMFIPTLAGGGRRLPQPTALLEASGRLRED